MFDPNDIAITKDQIRLIAAARGKLLVEVHKQLDGVVAARREPPDDDGLYHGQLVLSEVSPSLASIENVTLAELGFEPSAPEEPAKKTRRRSTKKASDLQPAAEKAYDDAGESGLNTGETEQTDPPAKEVEESEDASSSGQADA